MKISSLNTQNFTSRAKVVRQLDDINRQFMKKFVDIPSPSKIITRVDVFQGKNTKNNLPSGMETVCRKYLDRLKIMRADLDETPDVQEILKIVQKHKVANCGELTDMLSDDLKKKGFKPQKVNLVVRTLGATRRHSKDHCFLLINPKKRFDFYNPATWGSKSVVVDPWLGFVARKDEAIGKYASFFDLADDEFFIFTSI